MSKTSLQTINGGSVHIESSNYAERWIIVVRCLAMLCASGWGIIHYYNTPIWRYVKYAPYHVLHTLNLYTATPDDIRPNGNIIYDTLTLPSAIGLGVDQWVEEVKRQS